MVLAFSRALFNAGSSIEAKIAMIAITTRSSMSVKFFWFNLWQLIFMLFTITLFSLLYISLSSLMYLFIDVILVAEYVGVRLIGGYLL